MGSVREATFEDAVFLAPRLRDIDVEECKVLGNKTPLEALTLAFSLQGTPLTIVGDDGWPIGMFGVSAHQSLQAGVAWALFTDEVFEPRHARQFIRGCRKWIKAMGEDYPILFNYISARNVEAIRWLEWMGFKFPQLIPDMNGSGEAYYYFERKRNV